MKKRALSLIVAFCMMLGLAVSQAGICLAATEDTAICEVQNVDAKGVEAQQEAQAQPAAIGDNPERDERWSAFLAKLGAGFSDFMEGFGKVFSWFVKIFLP